MTSAIAKFVGKKILGEKLENRFGKEDPYFEQVPATRLDGTPSGKFKKRRKALPPGISEHDGQVLNKVKRRAYRLDMALCNCCGVRFGWGSVIGIVPAIGDVIDALLALMVIHTCSQIEGGLPATVKARMFMNVALDFGVGLVPFIGDVVDALFRANTRNAIILEQHLREQGKKNLRRSGQNLPAVDPSDPHEFDRLQRGDESPPHLTSRQPSRQGEMSTRPGNGHRSGNGNGSGNGSGNGNGNGNGGGRSDRPAAPAAPAAAKVRGDTRPARSSFFGRSSRARPQDEEMGVIDTNSGAGRR